MTYAETGLNPDLLAELKDAMHAAPGLEKQRRLEEIRTVLSESFTFHSHSMLGTSLLFLNSQPTTCSVRTECISITLGKECRCCVTRKRSRTT